ncbi:MAG TPA: hypothetical protein VNN22_24175 [Verrucomicrobiae bacterium]|nr:hypothetical protein [Verrucomicrobiae bacterium]
MKSQINIAALKKTIADAERIGQQLVADKYHGASHFVAGIRGSLSAAGELLAEHEKWTVANPEPADTAAAPTAPAPTAPAK